MSDTQRAFEDVVKRRESIPALPVDQYLAELDGLIAAHDYFRQDKVIPAIARGTASRDVVQRVALE
jgi:hypothetical protein